MAAVMASARERQAPKRDEILSVIRRGSYTGTTHDRADRWYAAWMDGNLTRGLDHPGYTTKAEAIEWTCVWLQDMIQDAEEPYDHSRAKEDRRNAYASSADE